MATQNKVIMAWSECSIDIALATDNLAFPSVLTSIGVINNNSTSLETSEGDTLEARQSGGGIVAKETTEGGFSLTTRVIEPSFEFLKTLGIAEDGATGELDVTTHMVPNQYAMKLTPKNTGAIGIKAPLCNISYKPGFSDQEGNYADITFDILQHQDASGKKKWYTRYKKA